MDLLLAVQEDARIDDASATWTAVSSHANSFGFDKAARNLKQASGKDGRVLEGLWIEFAFRGESVVPFPTR
ncbi:MAG: hypothetical protein HYR83_09705 [Planctomycetes bacterium]|nr:hypothetical protein [Planctomycetota bacterium]